MGQVTGNDGTVFRIEKEDEKVYVIEMVGPGAKWAANTRITKAQLTDLVRGIYNEFLSG